MNTYFGQLLPVCKDELFIVRLDELVSFNDYYKIYYEDYLEGIKKDHFYITENSKIIVPRNNRFYYVDIAEDPFEFAIFMKNACNGKFVRGEKKYIKFSSVNSTNNISFQFATYSLI